DLDTDYGELKRRFSEDAVLSKACAFAGGIRLLRQDSWETLSSFIISQNNNIPRIKGIISRLCEHYGGYPSVEQLKGETPDSLAFLRAGFRAKYIVDAVEKLTDGEVSVERAKTLPTDEARAELMKIKGVGPKVADCAMLFGMYRLDAFPKDVWVKRVMAKYYPDGLPDCISGAEGIAQQYLFHYIRNLDE
ncbi:MAG: DNA-3-methyladenine glycosylase 2 family protein, partial [Ruminococcus sp.]|nr:DNA-3-methyladenine glycosylase 2 family protein [Ruminococcus sp.]